MCMLNVYIWISELEKHMGVITIWYTEYIIKTDEAQERLRAKRFRTFKQGLGFIDFWKWVQGQLLSVPQTLGELPSWCHLNGRNAAKWPEIPPRFAPVGRIGVCLMSAVENFYEESYSLLPNSKLATALLCAHLSVCCTCKYKQYSKYSKCIKSDRNCET